MKIWTLWRDVALTGGFPEAPHLTEHGRALEITVRPCKTWRRPAVATAVEYRLGLDIDSRAWYLGLSHRNLRTPCRCLWQNVHFNHWWQNSRDSPQISFPLASRACSMPSLYIYRYSPRVPRRARRLLHTPLAFAQSKCGAHAQPEYKRQRNSGIVDWPLVGMSCGCRFLGFRDLCHPHLSARTSVPPACPKPQTLSTKTGPAEHSATSPRPQAMRAGR